LRCAHEPVRRLLENAFDTIELVERLDEHDDIGIVRPPGRRRLQ
jgi:hypothetical protein